MTGNAHASDPAARRDLAVAWMNRGHAQLLQGTDAAALTAYEHAIALLRPLPLAENPSWANSLGAACMNRGQLLHRLHGLTRADEVLAAFDEAAAALRPLVAPIDNPQSAIRNQKNPWPRRNLAGTQLNRANLLLDLARFSAAATAAREALTLSAPHEAADPVDADLALKARRAACDALGQLLVAPGADQAALAAEASDLVDDALALIRLWAARGETSFQPLAVRFFRFGAQLYQLHQPHFLAEFIRENLPLADGEFHAIARAAIDGVLAAPAFLISGDPATERRRAIWRELAALRPHLAA